MWPMHTPTIISIFGLDIIPVGKKMVTIRRKNGRWQVLIQRVNAP